MDCLPDSESFTYWLLHYGSIGLFILLAAGIVALPVPEETLMIFAGFLMQSGKLHIPGTLLAAYLGSMCGITLSYILGRTAGHYLILTYGSWFGIRPHHLETAHNWFEKYGKWSLAFGYFIPGVRHFTGISAGLAELEYRSFALFAYMGALFWVSTFLSIGYFFGNYCLTMIETIDRNLDKLFVGLIILSLIGLFFYWKSRKK